MQLKDVTAKWLEDTLTDAAAAKIHAMRAARVAALQEADNSPPATATRTPVQQMAEDHNKDLQVGTVTDEQLRELLMQEGEIDPLLRQRDANGPGKLWEDRFMDMLRSNRDAFAVDPKNPRVSGQFEIEIDMGDAAAIADKARHQQNRTCQSGPFRPIRGCSGCALNRLVRGGSGAHSGNLSEWP
jgi:hypothetical protein